MVVINGTIKHSEIHFQRSCVLSMGEHLNNSGLSKPQSSQKHFIPWVWISLSTPHKGDRLYYY